MLTSSCFLQVNKQLIVTVIEWMCSVKQQAINPGAVLVFLPGLADITAVLTEIHERAAFISDDEPQAVPEAWEGGLGGARVRVLPLLASLSSQDQQSVFLRPPNGIIKIVLATDIAETSVTIDDIGWVIDSAKLKETQ